MKPIHAQRNTVGPAAHAADASQKHENQLRAFLTKAGLYHQEWLRLPRTGARCNVCGLSRSTLNRLVLPSAINAHTPPVRSVVLKQRWAIRGIRLINRESLIDYLASFEGASAPRCVLPDESATALAKQDRFEQTMMAGWDSDPEAPDRARAQPLSTVARKRSCEILRALQAKRIHSDACITNDTRGMEASNE